MRASFMHRSADRNTFDLSAMVFPTSGDSQIGDSESINDHASFEGVDLLKVRLNLRLLIQNKT